MTLNLTSEDLVEMWHFEIRNLGNTTKRLQVFPYFPVGYMSWMNQSSSYDAKLDAIICSSISPYQKYQDYDKIKRFKDKTFLLAAEKPDAYEANQEAFEGEGGLHSPSSIKTGGLKNGCAVYETPTCAMQYNLELAPQEGKELEFIFGPAKDRSEIEQIRKKFIEEPFGFENAKSAYKEYIREGLNLLSIETPNKKLDAFVNQWLPRQIYYHGETNRLSTDPQTRNYLQDNMGMGYIKPKVARKAFEKALSQQQVSGAMPDGIIIVKGAELKYINQVPHTDHCVWLPVCLKSYLDETNDYEFLSSLQPFGDSAEKASAAEHIHRAMLWLLKNRDGRGLNYINQGDWCDPMNMVGYKGKGVSGWLSMATSYALKSWIEIIETYGLDIDTSVLKDGIKELNIAVNKHIWSEHWYGRGITDDDVLFGIPSDPEGKIFLNPQAWALLCDAANSEKEAQVIKAVEEELESPYGIEMLNPSFTSMREDVGRVTQKHPGSAENGSIYNHAEAFYIFALYSKGHANNAYRLIDKMIPGTEEKDLIQRGQLPVFIPNYYRGAYRQFPGTAGRSSQLFNTGTVHWIYRCLIEGLFGLKGEPDGLRVVPQLPDGWRQVMVTRQFRGAIFHIEMRVSQDASSIQVLQNKELLKDNLIRNFERNKEYLISVILPEPTH
jgi:cellobionic acid phosphorylase